MKKVLAFLAVFCLCFSMIGTASADDASYNYANSDVNTFLSAHSSDFSDYRYLVISSTKGATQTGYVYSWSVYASNSVFNYSHKNQFDKYIITGSGDFVRYYYSVGNTTNPVTTSYTSGNTFQLSSSPSAVNEKYYLNFDLSSPVQYTYIDFKSGSSECDGSTCPATDVNFDDYCDDCGGLLTYNLRVTPDTFNIVVKHSDSLTLKYSYTETLDGTTFNATYSNERITVTFDNPMNHYQYKLVDGNWELSASYPNTYGNHVISLSNGASVLTSDANIYNEDGTLFFQNPLWVTVEAVTQGEMLGLTQTTVGTMKILMVCGVGCLALLIALLLLPKVLHRFLR